MLFTVNVETSGLPPAILLSKLVLGYGAKSLPFTLTEGKTNYPHEFPQESETGLIVVPGSVELDLLIKFFSKCIHVANVKSAPLMGYKNFKWPGHVFANKPSYVRYTVERVKPRLMCTDVDWLCELVDAESDTVGCRITIKQRIYPL